MRTLLWTCGVLLFSACSTGGLAPVGAGSPFIETYEPVAAVPGEPVPLADNGFPAPREEASAAPVPLEGSASVAFEPSEGRSLFTTAAVNVRLKLSGLSGSRKLSAEFIAPGAGVFETRSEQVSAEGGAAQEVVFNLPVAGTFIPEKGLSGRWDVRFFLDGEPLAATDFTLEP